VSSFRVILYIYQARKNEVWHSSTILIDIFYEPLYINLNLRVSGSYQKVNDSGKGIRREKSQESSTRYEIWNYLQVRPISYQKAIKSFCDLEITSAPGGVLSEVWSAPHHDSLTQALAPITSLRCGRDACRLNDFFPLFPALFFWPHVTAARKKKHFRCPALKTRLTEATATAADEDPSSSSSFSFSRNYLDRRFLFSYSKRFIVPIELSKSEVFNRHRIERIHMKSIQLTEQNFIEFADQITCKLIEQHLTLSEFWTKFWNIKLMVIFLFIWLNPVLFIYFV